MSIRKYFKEKDVIIEFYGLKPLTTYYFYFDGKKITDRVKQFGKKLNQPLISDENGQLKTIYYLSSGIESDSLQSVPVRTKNLRAGSKEVVVTTINQTSLPENYKDSSVSFSSVKLGLEKNF